MAWLLLFLVVAAAVVARQTAAIQAAARLRALRDERRALEARRGETERRIREASSRQILGRKAEALGLHQPADSEFVLFPMAPTGADGERP